MTRRVIAFGRYVAGVPMWEIIVTTAGRSERYGAQGHTAELAFAEFSSRLLAPLPAKVLVAVVPVDAKIAKNATSSEKDKLST